MAQVTLYMPEPLLQRLKQDARRQSRSLSSVVVERLEAKARDDGWPPGFWDRFRSDESGTGNMEVPVDHLPEGVPEL